jgi:vacuolar-type H+-ATPase catalytic subunit A/Vma1
MTSLMEYITVVSNNQISWYMEQNKTYEEESKYYTSEAFGLHLNYLIETWVSTIKNEFNNNDKIMKLLNNKEIVDKIVNLTKSNDLINSENLIDEVLKIYKSDNNINSNIESIKKNN